MIDHLLNKIHKENSIDFLKNLPNDCIDIFVLSPPYNMGNINRSENPKRVKRNLENETVSNSSRNMTLFNEGYSDFDDCLPYSQYIKQQRTLIKEMVRCLTTGGAIFYNTKWRLYNGLLDDLHLITEDFPLRQIILWNKFSTMAYSETFFLPKYEVIYLFCKGENSTLKFKKDGILLGDIWEFSGDKDNKHPAPFPVMLPYNAISSVENNGRKLTVYDPYFGSGTTGVAAEICGYNWIGTDISDQYIEMATKRIIKNRTQSELHYINKSEQAKNFKMFDNKSEDVNVKRITF